MGYLNTTHVKEDSLKMKEKTGQNFGLQRNRMGLGGGGDEHVKKM